MSQAIASPGVTPSFPPLAYQGVPVLTTKMLAQAYEVEAKQIRQNFANNRERFIEGKHFFQLSANDLREFKNYVENFDLVQIDKRARHFTLWTERGAARNAKMLNSDRAWDVFELLEETFFRVVRVDAKPTPSPSAPITPADQSILQSIVKAKVEALPEERRSKGLYPQIWGRFNNHFRLGSYRQLPQCRMADAVAYLTQLAVREPAQALPPTIESLRVTDNAASADLDAHLDAIQEHIRAIFDHQCSIFRLGRNALPSRSAVPSRVWGASVLTLDSLEKSSDALRACLASLELSARAAVVAGRA